MADGTLKVGTITNSQGSGNLGITIGSGVTVSGAGKYFLLFLHILSSASNCCEIVQTTKIQFNTESYLILIMAAFDNSTNYRFTVPTVGKLESIFFNAG